MTELVMDTISVAPEEPEHSGSDMDNAPVTLVNSGHMQPSVIQSVGGHIIQVGQDGDAGSVLTSHHEDEESRKRRDLLARRPSYRKIFNELSDTSDSITVAKIEEESDSCDSDLDTSTAGNHSVANNINNTSVANVQYSQGQVPGTIQIAAHGDGAAQGIQTLTMSNITSTPQQVNNSGATIVQYAQGPDGQFFIPGSISYQLAPASGLGQGVAMVTGGNNVSGSPPTVGEEASRKRELRLLKNREAARECRRKKKEYIKCLENRVALLENQNKTLIEELKSLKELYCQKDVQS